MTLPQEASNLGEGLLVRPRAAGRAAGAREPGGSQLRIHEASCTRSAAIPGPKRLPLAQALPCPPPS